MVNKKTQGVIGIHPITTVPERNRLPEARGCPWISDTKERHRARVGLPTCGAGSPDVRAAGLNLPCTYLLLTYLAGSLSSDSPSVLRESLASFLLLCTKAAWGPRRLAMASLV